MEYIDNFNDNDECHKISIEACAKELNVLHKYVHKVFAKLVQEGKLKQCRIHNPFKRSGQVTHTMPWYYNGYIRYNDGRHPNYYQKTEKWLSIRPTDA